jgi:predicted AAA+ superfamily ATPase
LVSARKLAPLLNIAVSTLLEYFSYLEDTYLINFIPKFSYSLKAQLVNPKKTYCIDNGLIKTLSTSFTKDYGRVLENAVYCHLRRKSKEIYYFNEDNAECDFVSCQNGAPVELVQVCYDFNRETMAREQKGLKEAMNFFKISNAKIITYNQSDMYIQDGKKIQVIPSWKYMSQE